MLPMTRKELGINDATTILGKDGWLSEEMLNYLEHPGIVDGQCGPGFVDPLRQPKHASHIDIPMCSHMLKVNRVH